MRTTWRVALMALLTAAAMVCGAGTALAAPKTTAAAPAATKAASGTPAPLVQGTLGVQVNPDETHSQAGVILGVTLGADVKLPARVQVPLPDGATIQWAGEVLGGDPSADPQRTYTIHDGTGGKYAEFTVEQGRLAQIETLASPLKVSGNNVSMRVDYVQSAQSLSSEFSVRLPANVSGIQIDPKPNGSPDKNQAGETLYSLGIQKMSPGTKLAISVSYTRGGGSSSAPVTTASSQTPLFVVLGIALVVVLVALALVLQRRSGSGEADDAELGDISDDSADTWAIDDDAAADTVKSDMESSEGSSASEDSSGSDSSASSQDSGDPFDTES